MHRFIECKTILASVKSKPDPYFGLSYNMNLYHGCQHGCIYCDSRSKCYQLGSLSDIRIKKDAIQILENELRRKKVRGTVGFGSMNDCYMPIEKEELLTVQALELMKRYKFPIHIITKSNLVERDISLLQEISKIYAAVSFSITTADDNLSKIIEPGAPTTSERFLAIKRLSDAGIYCGICFMPILPFINDTLDNVSSIVHMAKECGAQYILSYFGLTIRDGQREYMYQKFDEHFPGMITKYEQEFGFRYNCSSPKANELYAYLSILCERTGITTRMRFYNPRQYIQHTLF